MGSGESLTNYENVKKFIKILKLNSPIGSGNVLNTNNCEISICETRIKNKYIMNNTISEKEIQRNREEQDALWKICGELAEYHEELKYQTALPDEVEMLERDRISDALAKTEGNQSKAAKLLKIGRTNLIAKMKKYDFPFISSQ